MKGVLKSAFFSFLLIFSTSVCAQNKSENTDDLEIEIEDTEDTEEKKEEKKPVVVKKEEKINVDEIVGDDSPEKITLSADEPFEAIDINSRKLKKSKKEVSGIFFFIESSAGAGIGLVDLIKTHGLLINANPGFRFGRHFALLSTLSLGFLFDGSFTGYSLLAISLEPRLYIPIIKKSKITDEGAVDMFLSLRIGYRSEEASIENETRELSGINSEAGMGFNYFINKNLYLTWQFYYGFPFWINSCDPAAGSLHCNSASGITGHRISLLFGLGISFN
ncbi:MAG: hypothetical protein JXR95_00740 [Deltaproteobacteria bacterium]|nr:hypothetical protein [Deltaproteobacteria bacterium]